MAQSDRMSVGGTLEGPWKSGRQGNLCPLEQVRSPRTSAGRSLAGADLVAAAFVTGASKSARAPDGPAGRQAPNSLSTSLKNILPLINAAGWLPKLGCRAGLSCWAVRLGCPSPCMAVWLAGWPGRLAGLPGLACPPAPPPLQTPQPAQPAYRNWVADLTGRRRRQRPKRQRPRPTTAGCGVPQPAPATGAVCDPIPILPVAPVVSFRGMVINDMFF